jgi:putative Holliday junction resolvase
MSAMRETALPRHSSEKNAFRIAEAADAATLVLPAAGTVLAFDFGTRRIGVASAELSVGMAHPLTTLAAADRERRDEAIGDLVRTWQPVWLVVGLPTHVDGAEHELTARCRRFASELHKRFTLPVSLVDERLSTQAARSALDEQGVRGRRQKDVRDQVAAQMILQNFLDERPHVPA